jgi:hypothetical protein
MTHSGGALAMVRHYSPFECPALRVPGMFPG